MKAKQDMNPLDERTPPMGVMPVKVQGLTGLASQAEVVLDALQFHLHDTKTDQMYHIGKFPFIIGRLPSCDLCIQDKQVGREHALILRVKNALVLTNEGGYDNVRVNGYKIKRVIMQDGDTISIADQSFTFHARIREASSVEAGQGNPTQDIDNNVSIDLHHEARPRNRRIWMTILLLASISILMLFGYQLLSSRYQDSRNNKVFTIETNTDTSPQTATTAPTTETDLVTAKAATSQADTPVNTVGGDAAAGQNTLTDIRHVSENTPNNTSAGRQQQKAIDSDHVQPTTKLTAVSKPAGKKSTQVERQYAQQQISDAVQRYHQGEFEGSRQALEAITNNRRYQAEYRMQARQLAQQITELQDYYIAGQQAFDNGERDTAFDTWVKLLHKHKQYFPGTPAFFADEIKEKVAQEYERRGNLAYASDALPSAYRHWTRALAIRPKASTQKSVDMMDEDIQQLYRTGYRYETVNIDRALQYWQSLLAKAPPDHPYYIKASAKIQWYQNRQSNVETP